MKRALIATLALAALSTGAFAQGSPPAASATVTPAPVVVAVVPVPMFATVPVGDDLSSNLVGLDIYNSAKDKIGTVKDIAMTGGRVRAYIVGVGGFLGMGDHYVAVSPSAIAITYGATDKKWHATMNADAAALKAAPEYKYAS
jgi:hypothetical protein